MKVLLTSDIESIGWLGDVVQVSSGYARNFLLPQGLAKPATEQNIKSIADEKASNAKLRMRRREQLETVAAAVEHAEAVIAAKANEQGHLFGSVTAEQIAENLRQQGFEVADEVVQLGEHIRQVGTHSVALKFADDLTVTINVVVVAEQKEPAEGGDA